MHLKSIPAANPEIGPGRGGFGLLALPAFPPSVSSFLPKVRGKGQPPPPPGPSPRSATAFAMLSLYLSHYVMYIAFIYAVYPKCANDTGFDVSLRFFT